MTDVTVEDLDFRQEAIFMQRKDYEFKKKLATEANKQLVKMQMEHIAVLQELDKVKYQSASGTFSYRPEESFKVPSTPEDRKLFFDYLKEKGIFDAMITVNSRTLNAFAKEEGVIQEGQGNFDFEIPGLEKSPVVYKPTLRKA